MLASPGLIAVDIGNSRVKLGFFSATDLAALSNARHPSPSNALELESRNLDAARLSAWLRQQPSPRRWSIASVNRPTLEALSSLIPKDPNDKDNEHAHVVRYGDLPLVVSLERPDRVGIDRLLSAVAVNRLRQPDRPAIVVSVGTAITVDLVAADGAFLGGAILPGIAMSARALDEQTDLLPLIPMSELAVPPPPLGVDTEAAMRSGIYWGAVGAIRELAARLADTVNRSLDQTDLFLTGGAAPIVASLIGPQAQHVEHLTLCGIALASLHTSGGN